MSGLFAVNKPSGISSAGLLNDLQHIFKKSPLFESEIRAQQLRGNAGRHKLKMQNKIKMGHGGTLDPLASGVLVVGTGQGTKLLSQFLSCSKDYEAVALFGCSTDTYDSEGKIVHKKPWKHITRELLESTIGQFRGDIRQIPPIYSALKMEGKPLYEYAREGKPLPRAIEARSANVSRFEITKFTTDHGWTFPKEMASEETILSADLLEGIRPQANLTSLPAEQPITSNAEGPSEEAGRPTKRVKTDEDTSNDKEQDRTSDASHEHPLAVHIKMTVSSGTYVRSLIHDLGLALGSAAHMVALVRNRVGDFTLEDAIAWEAFQTNSWQDAICKKLKLEQQVKAENSLPVDDLDESVLALLTPIEQQVRSFLHPCKPFKRTLTYAQSLDAKISGPNSRPLVISCPESFRITHELRRSHDMIIVGVGTALSDDPGLNARDAEGKPYSLDKQPIPIIIDPNGRLSLQSNSKLMSNARKNLGKRPVQLVHVNRLGQFETAADVIYIKPHEEHELKFKWSEIFDAIKHLGNTIMIEGGASVIQDLLQERAVDQVITTIAPVYIGEGTAIVLSDTVRLSGVRTETFGRDAVIAGKIASKAETLRPQR